MVILLLLPVVALLALVAYLEGFHFVDFMCCVTGNVTRCVAFFTAAVAASAYVEVSGVGWLILFAFQFYYMLVLLFGLFTWCNARVRRTRRRLRRRLRSVLAWSRWMYYHVCSAQACMDFLILCTSKRPVFVSFFVS